MTPPTLPSSTSAPSTASGAQPATPTGSDGLPNPPNTSANQPEPTTPAQQPPSAEPAQQPSSGEEREKDINFASARKAQDLYKLTERIIGKSGITMTAELVARVAVMVSLISYYSRHTSDIRCSVGSLSSSTTVRTIGPRSMRTSRRFARRQARVVTQSLGWIGE
jgi:hypothetical protein